MDGKNEMRLSEIIHLDELTSICGFFEQETNVNNGYGCNHIDCGDGTYVVSKKGYDEYIFKYVRKSN